MLVWYKYVLFSYAICVHQIMQQSTVGSSTGNTGLVLLTPADFARPLQKSDPLNDKSQHRAGEQQPATHYSSSSAAVYSHPHYVLKWDQSGRPTINYDYHRLHNQKVLQPLKQAPVVGSTRRSTVWEVQDSIGVGRRGN